MILVQGDNGQVRTSTGACDLKDANLYDSGALLSSGTVIQGSVAAYSNPGGFINVGVIWEWKHAILLVILSSNDLILFT